MAVSFVKVGPFSGDSGSYPQITGIAAGDVLVAFVAATQSGTISSDGSWTLLGSVTTNSNGRVYVFWKTAGSSTEPASSFTCSTSNAFQATSIIGVYRGVTQAPVLSGSTAFVQGNTNGFSHGGAAAAKAGMGVSYGYANDSSGGNSRTASSGVGTTRYNPSATRVNCGLADYQVTQGQSLSGSWSWGGLYTESVTFIGHLVALGYVDPPTTTLTGPGDGESRDFTKAVALTWSTALGTGGTAQPNAFAIRRAPSAGGTTEWWSGSAWTTTETFLSQTAGSYTFPAGAWGANGTSYLWSVAARSSEGTGPYSATRTLVGRPDATFTITSPAANGDTTPLTGPVITLSATAGSGGTLDASQIGVYTAADWAANGLLGTPVYASTSSSAYASSFDLPGGTLTNGASYVVAARVRQTTGQWTQWSARSFTVQQPNVAVPVLSVVVAQSGTPRITATTTWSRGSTVGSAAVTLQRSLDGQQSWQTLQTVDGGTSGDVTVTQDDTSLPTGQTAFYRSRTAVTNGDETVTSAWSPVQSGVFSVYADYLVNLTTGVSSVARLQVYDHAARPWFGEVVYPLEGDTAIILSGRQYKREGSAVAAFRTWPGGLQFEAALLGIFPLLWRRPVDSSGWQRPDATIRVRPGSVRIRPADPSLVRWAACVVEFDWITQ